MHTCIAVSCAVAPVVGLRARASLRRRRNLITPEIEGARRLSVTFGTRLGFAAGAGGTEGTYDLRTSHTNGERQQQATCGSLIPVTPVGHPTSDAIAIHLARGAPETTRSKTIFAS